ncbi:MAG: choice-of-anchor J domain-containing protein [Flavobacteriaceae bacterium]|nr:choice-of-anchor J domain-containing protein [Flavobacteriaceae bacterium]
MKRIIYLLAIVGVIFTGCNPIEDIYDEIDARDNPIVGSAEYTLTSEDYEDLDLNFGNFSSEDDAKAILPGFLNDLYPIWGEGSSVLVGYNLYIGNAEGVSDFTGADTYQLTNDDYATSGSDAFGFYPNIDPNDFIPDILDAAIASPVEGQLVRADYDQYFNDPVVGLANLYQASFPANFDDFENIDVLGAQGWSAGSGNVQGSGWDGGAFANEDWLISPEIDLTGETDLKFQINQEIDFFGAEPESIDIIISTDYTTGGDHTAATWTTFDFDKTLYGSLTLSEDFDFSAYDDQVIHVAFKYASDDVAAARWRIESFAIKTLGVDGDANNKGDYYVYDGGWELADDVYYLSKADYDSMGENSGEPGRFNNFSSSTPADAYIPTFLSINNPFAFGQEEDQIIVVYKYFSTSCFCTQTRGNQYTVIDGEWTPHSSVISTTLQFGHDGDSWVPDNTIRYTLTGADVSFISDTFSTIYPGPADNVGFFGSFDRRPSSDNFWSDDMLLEAFNALLDNIDPSAQEGQKYVLTFVTYIGSVADESMSLIKTGGVWVLQ